MANAVEMGEGGDKGKTPRDIFQLTEYIVLNERLNESLYNTYGA